MKKLIITMLAVTACFALPTLSATADSATNEGLHISDAYIRTMPPGRSTTAAFLSIANHTGQSCRITEADSELSDRLEFHQHLHADGMMRMRKVTGGINLAAGETVVFKPGGLHIMLFNIDQPLIAGESTQLKLNTDQCGSVSFNVQILSLVPAPMKEMHH